MPFKSAWFVEGRVAYTRIEGALTVGDLPALDQAQQQFLDQSTGILTHTLWDFRGANEVPSPLILKRDLTFPNHKKFGWAIIIGIDNPITRLTLTIAPQLFRVRFRHWETVAQALDFLQMVDSTLPDLYEIQRNHHIVSTD
ncbi:MAG TPA: hypothetical protein VHL11_01070 [Phototrophicaceae bacterium]|jgi:hypothetical protein|nr:hypothetical protein [Phototrophicaceae bacterium]